MWLRTRPTLEFGHLLALFAQQDSKFETARQCGDEGGGESLQDIKMKLQQVLRVHQF